MAQGACIFGCSGADLTRTEADFFRDADPWGFILFTRNVRAPAQLRRLTSALRDCVGRDAPILIDQEGGRVARMGPPYWRSWLPPLDQMRTAGPERAARSMFLRYRLIAAELHAVGIDVNCAPVADLAFAATHPFLRNRCYSGEPPAVIGAARAVAQGLMAGGVLPVLKHIPGHGRAEVDSHLDLPRVTAPLADLRRDDFAAFRGLAELPLAMTAHIVYPAIDPARPATQSPDVVRLIRDDIGFDGCLMTDDICMQALQGTMGERAALARGAGCDLVLHCNGNVAEMRAVATEAGRLDGQSGARARRALAARRAPDDVDLAGLETELDGIMGPVAHGAAHGH